MAVKAEKFLACRVGPFFRDLFWLCLVKKACLIIATFATNRHGFTKQDTLVTFCCFILASCRKRIGNGHQYELQWSDGTLTAQHLSCIFGAHTKRRQINVGE